MLQLAVACISHLQAGFRPCRAPPGEWVKQPLCLQSALLSLQERCGRASSCAATQGKHIRFPAGG